MQVYNISKNFIFLNALDLHDNYKPYTFVTVLIK